jgi:hypothetical protein
MMPRTVTFTPALPCADCGSPTRQGFIAPMNLLAWQLVPLCARDLDSSAGQEAFSADSADLQDRIARQLQVLHQLQRRRQRLTRDYLRLRRQHTHCHAHWKAQRALRIGLKRSYRRQAQMREEGTGAISNRCATGGSCMSTRPRTYQTPRSLSTQNPKPLDKIVFL